MRIVEILETIKKESGSNAKKEILQANSQNQVLQKLLRYSLDPFMPFNVVKVPKVKARSEMTLTGDEAWTEFFRVADMCARREISGNSAIESLQSCFSLVTKEQESWMRKVLKKHLAIGVSTKSVNKVFPGLIPTFDVSLAQKFESKRIEGKRICIEPKLDGIRCLAVVRNGQTIMLARSGKQITNFDGTIGRELSLLPDGVYDGEIMGKDFVSLMRQAYRKEDVVTDDTYLAIFDFVPLSEWDSKKSQMSCEDRYIFLMHNVHSNKMFNYLRVVNRSYCNNQEIEKYHDEYVEQGYEGAMIKDLDAPYKFGRGFEVMKFKKFHDVDLKIEKLLEGTGRHSEKLGSVVVNYHGVEVQVGSGFSDSLRETIWSDPESFIGRMIEVRYQEVTPDGSLRFPTFVCFRNDR